MSDVLTQEQLDAIRARLVGYGESVVIWGDLTGVEARGLLDDADALLTLANTLAARLAAAEERAHMAEVEVKIAWDEARASHTEVKRLAGQLRAERGRYAALVDAALEALAVPEGDNEKESANG